MPQKIASLTLLALTAFYSVSASAQPGPPRAPNSRGPQSHGQYGPQHRGPQSHGQHGPQDRGPQSHGQRGPQDRGSQPQTRAPQSRPDQRPGVAPSVDMREQGAKILQALRKAVEAGEITREQARERFNAWRQRISGKASQPAPQTQSRPAVPAAKEIPVPPVRPAERKPQSAQGAKLKSEAIPATKIQPSRIFQLPPKKKEKK